MTIDEELNVLEDNIRRLKVEYDVYFGGGNKRPPADLEWRVQSTLKKHIDGARMNFGQRFRYNTLAQKYALFSSLWRQKLQIKEEGYRRPQDALLGVQGVRTEEEHAAKAALSKRRKGLEEQQAFVAQVADPNADQNKVRLLFDAMQAARKKAGAPANANFESFQQFVSQKTEQLKNEYKCSAVEYSVTVENGQVRLKAKAQ